MKNLLKVLALLTIVSFALTACGGGEDEDVVKPAARINVVLPASPPSLPTAQKIVVDASKKGTYLISVNIDNGRRSQYVKASFAVDSLVGSPVTGGLFIDETLNVDRYHESNFVVRFTPGVFTLLLDGIRTDVTITVNPFGTTPSPTTTVVPA